MKKMILMVTLLSVPLHANEIKDFSNTVKPFGYQSMVTRMSKAGLRDPYSAKIKIQEPRKVECNASNETLTSRNYYKFWAIPVLVNAKNAYGGYTGNKLKLFYMYNNKLISMASGNLIHRRNVEENYCTLRPSKVAMLKNKPIKTTNTKQKPQSNTVHSHSDRSHSHALPDKGVAHRHGNGSIGK